MTPNSSVTLAEAPRDSNIPNEPKTDGQLMSASGRKRPFCFSHAKPTLLDRPLSDIAAIGSKPVAGSAQPATLTR